MLVAAVRRVPDHVHAETPRHGLGRRILGPYERDDPRFVELGERVITARERALARKAMAPVRTVQEIADLALLDTVNGLTHEADVTDRRSSLRSNPLSGEP